MAARIAPSRSVPVSMRGISARPAERLGGPEPGGSKSRQERQQKDGGVDDHDRKQDVRVIEGELTFGREARQQRASKPKSNGQANDESDGRDQRRFDQHAGENLQLEEANRSQNTN